jgi:hypothetical protein
MLGMPCFRRIADGRHPRTRIVSESRPKTRVSNVDAVQFALQLSLPLGNNVTTVGMSPWKS